MDHRLHVGVQLQGSASPLTRGSRCMTADLVQDAALDPSTVARLDTKLYSAARSRVRALSILMIDPFSAPWGTVI